MGDVHRTLLYGGIFGYPSDLNNPDGEPHETEKFNPSFVELGFGGPWCQIQPNAPSRYMAVLVMMVHFWRRDGVILRRNGS